MENIILVTLIVSVILNIILAYQYGYNKAKTEKDGQPKATFTENVKEIIQEIKTESYKDSDYVSEEQRLDEIRLYNIDAANTDLPFKEVK